MWKCPRSTIFAAWISNKFFVKTALNGHYMQIAGDRGGA